MQDGEWIKLGGTDGATLAAVCIVGVDGRETLLSELGDRLVPVVSGLFENAATGQRYVLQERPTTAQRELDDYRVAFETAAGFVRLRIDGDFRHCGSVDREWDNAFERLGDATRIERVLILRGPGRMANDLVKLQQLQRFTQRGHLVELIAVIFPPGDSGRGAMFATVAALRGLVVRIFETDAEAEAWLRA